MARSGFDLGLRFSVFLIETLSITGQKFSKCRKSGSDRFSKGTTGAPTVTLPSFSLSTQSKY